MFCQMEEEVAEELDYKLDWIVWRRKPVIEEESSIREEEGRT